MYNMCTVTYDFVMILLHKVVLRTYFHKKKLSYTYVLNRKTLSIEKYNILKTHFM